MKVAFFGQTGPYSTPALRRLLQASGAGYEVRAVVEGMPKGHAGRRHRWLAPKRGVATAGEDLARAAIAAGIETLQTGDVNAPYVAQTLAQRGIEALVCAGFPCLFDAALLRCGPRGAINAHPSLLPRWRGPAPLFWALRAGDARLGVTIHHMDGMADHGPIITQEAFVRTARAEGGVLYARAGRLAGALLADALGKMAQGHLLAVPQQHAAASRAPRPKPEDACVIPAQWRCDHLVDFACGAPFFRAPWMVVGGETFHLRSGIDAMPGQRLPGEFVVRGDTLWVPCRDGTAVLKIQA